MLDYGLLFGCISFGVLCIVMQGKFSYDDGFFSKTQMLAKGYENGIPFLAHGEMWTDLLLITQLCAFIVARYGYQWSLSAITLCLVIGFIASWAFHIMYVSDSEDMPGCHAHDGMLTAAGWVHLGYMAVALTALLLFYFSTSSDKTTVLIVGGLLILHIIWGSLEIPWYVKRPIINFSNMVEIVVGLVVIAIGTAINFKYINPN